jgi:hypothetical protein
MMVHMRLGNWFHFIETGMAPREAMMRTLLAMPDMSNITVFEKNVMRKIMPWYTWTRTNGSLQLAYHLPNSPEFMAAAGRFPHALEGLSALWRGDAANIPEELRPEWMREGGAGQVLGDDKQGSVFMARNWFPFEEPMVLATALASPQQGLGMAANQLRPGIKFGMETAFGQDLLRHRPITPFSLQEVYEHPSILPKALIGGSGTSLDQLGTMRPLREIRRVAEQPTLSGEAARVFTGGGIQNIDAAKAAEATDRDLNRQLSELRVKYLRAEENRDEVEQQSILRKMMALKAKRQGMGMKNPKGTQQALAGVGVTQ